MNDYIHEFLSYIGHWVIALIGITIGGIITLFRKLFPHPRTNKPISRPLERRK